MRRLSVSKAMLIVALAAAHLAVLRFLISTCNGPSFLLALLVGLLPLAEAQLIGLYLTARWYCFTLKRRDHASRGMSAVAFSAFNAILLILLIVISHAATEEIGRGFAAIVQPINDGFQWLGYTHEDFAAPYFRLFVSPLILGAMMSGPPLLLSLAFGCFVKRYELVITRRQDTEARRQSRHIERW